MVNKTTIVVIVVALIIILGAGIGFVALGQTSSTTMQSNSTTGNTTLITVTSTTSSSSGSPTLSSTSSSLSSTSTFSQITTTFSGSQTATPPITVNQTNSNYATVSTKPTGWLSTGESADLLLSGVGINNSGGGLLFNHPGNVATDGTHLLLADRNNNRILVWLTLPKGNTPPDLVLGQKNFVSNNPGRGLDQMDWPVGVSVAPDGKVVVADTWNNRILIWNSFPTTNGQPADLAIYGDPSAVINSPSVIRSIVWPWGVWTDGTKLVLASTGSSVVLIWNKFPTQNNQSADIYLTAGGRMGTPRTITSDGQHLIVGDHNANGNTPGVPSQQGDFVWNSFPTTNDQTPDYFMSFSPLSWLTGSFTQDGKLVMIGQQLFIWNNFPTSVNAMSDLTVGRVLCAIGQTNCGSGYLFDSGDGSGVAIAGGMVYVSLFNGNKIVAYNSLPSSSGQIPDFAIGSPNIDTNTLLTNYIMSNPLPITDGKSLFVASDFDAKLYVYKSIPNQNNAYPDYVYDFHGVGLQPWDGALYNGTLILAGGRQILVWKTPPVSGQLPDLVFTQQIGSASLQNIRGVAYDGKYFYVADDAANKVYVWQGIPQQNTNPLFSISVNQPGRLSSDGNYLVVCGPSPTGQNVMPTYGPAGPTGSVMIYSINGLSSTSQPLYTIQGNMYPQKGLVAKGHLFVTDTTFNRVLIWNNISQAIGGGAWNLTLGCALNSMACSYAAIGANTLFWPSGVAFDGSYLWIGEFKFSERILRFSVH